MITLVIGIAILMLHIFLSKKENKYLGLIIPSIYVLLSILTCVGAAMFIGVIDADTIVQSVIIFITYNIPTLIFMAIYFSCRKKVNKISELDKMNIQDLN